jgi:hypothetical protein
MLSLDELLIAFREEAGEEIAALVRDPVLERWINQGQARLGYYRQQSASFTWDANDLGFDLPVDFKRPEKLVADYGSACVPAGTYWNDEYRFNSRVTSSGSGVIYYWGAFPEITATQDSLLPDIGDDGILSYCAYRFYKRLASSRADFRRYATLTQANGVDISELDALSERYFTDFEDTREALADLIQNPSSFYGE